MTVDLAWRDAVREACEPALVSADVGFVWNAMNFNADQPNLLWEADPERFARPVDVRWGAPRLWRSPCHLPSGQAWQAERLSSMDIWECPAKQGTR